ncbi:MAG: hypothetical protein IJ349_04110 [Clostridia bacterium]|nr:hypothetical protein [Clostridia bacterium]
MENVFELVGVQKIDFTDKDGKRVQGTTIYFNMDATPQQRANGFNGKIAGKQYFPGGANIPSSVTCGQHYEFLFGYSKGKAVVNGFRAVTK